MADVILEGTGSNRRCPSHARCTICNKKPVAGDAVIRQAAPEIGRIFTHRRCMEELLAVSVQDEATEKELFEEYRLATAEKLGLVVR